MTFESQARNVNFYFALIFVFFLFFLLWAPSTVFCLQIDLDKHSHSAKRPYSSFFHVATKVIFTFLRFHLSRAFSVFRYIFMNKWTYISTLHLTCQDFLGLLYFTLFTGIPCGFEKPTTASSKCSLPWNTISFTKCGFVAQSNSIV